MKKYNGQILFGIGILAIVFIAVMSALAQQIFRDDASSLVSDEQGTVESQQDSDPFVTVVPKEVLGGKPQPLDTDPKRGATTGEPLVTIVEFGDFECESCAAMSPIMRKIVEEYPDDVLHVWKDFPLPQEHIFSETAAQAARCAQDQSEDAFWTYHDALLESQSTFALGPWSDIAADIGLDEEEFTGCLESGTKESLVVQGYFVAKTLDIEERPSYYVNERVVVGSKTYEEFKAIVDEEIADANTTQ